MYSVKRGNFFAFIFIVQFITLSYLFEFVMANYFPDTKLDTITSIAITQLVIVALPSLVYFIITRMPVRKTLRLNPISPLNALMVALVALTCIPTTMFINLISQLFVTAPINEAIQDVANEPFMLSLGVIAIFPAIFEELITRGIILSHYRRKSFVTASLMCGVFFGMIHLNFNQFLYAFFLGTLFAIVLHITESIFSTMIMHFIVNGTNLVFMYIANLPIVQEMSQLSSTSIDAASQREVLMMALPGMLIFVLITLPLMLVLIYGLLVINKKMDLFRSNASSEAFFDMDVIKAENTANSEIAPKSSETVMSVILMATVLIFLIMAISTEILTRST